MDTWLPSVGLLSKVTASRVLLPALRKRDVAIIMDRTPFLCLPMFLTPVFEERKLFSVFRVIRDPGWSLSKRYKCQILKSYVEEDPPDDMLPRWLLYFVFYYSTLVTS